MVEVIQSLMSFNKGVNMFKVGQDVWCLMFGKGCVVNVLSDVNFPVVVLFEFGTRTYSLDGRYEEDSKRTLFFSEPKIEARETPPFTPTMIGKIVKITDKFGGVWYRKVSDENENSLLCHKDGVVQSAYSHVTSTWSKSGNRFEIIA